MRGNRSVIYRESGQDRSACRVRKGHCMGSGGQISRLPSKSTELVFLRLILDSHE